jgi:hypothetical protein
VIPSGDHGNHLKEFGKNPNKGYYKHAPQSDMSYSLSDGQLKEKLFIL